MQTSTFDEITRLMRELSVQEKLRLAESILSDLQGDLSGQEPRRSLFGLWSDLGSAPSMEDIDAARREAWSTFPREDIG